jgi:heme/copper-type cytochrome/quinol oxidase subunit 2
MSIEKWGVVFFVLALVLNEMVLRLEKNRWDTVASSTGTYTVRCGGLSTRN